MPRLPRPVPIQRAARLPRRGTGGTLLGVFIGLVLGIALAATVGLYVTGGWKAYQQQVAGGRESRDAAREPAKSAKADADKPRFDFYKILPGGEEAKVAPAKPAPPDRSLADKAAQASSGRVPAEAPPVADKGKAADAVASVDPVAKPPDRFWLQAGSFSNESDAENLRARLALAGWEAQLQQGTLPDKAVRYRVRLGPYDNVGELNRIKGELARRGFDVAVIRY
jgi:cell division protein FtsN